MSRFQSMKEVKHIIKSINYFYILFTRKSTFSLSCFSMLFTRKSNLLLSFLSISLLYAGNISSRNSLFFSIRKRIHVYPSYQWRSSYLWHLKIRKQAGYRIQSSRIALSEGVNCPQANRNYQIEPTANADTSSLSENRRLWYTEWLYFNATSSNVQQN